MDKKQQSSFLSSLQQDYHSQKNIYSQNLSSLQAQKTALNQDLTQKIEKLTQLLEKKAMTKEDLNGKLLQRAESIAQREELELFLESRQYEDYIAYENMKHFFEKEFDLQKEREILTFEKKNKENDYKRRENELMEKEEEFFTWNQKKLKLLDDRMKKLNENNELNENIEEELNKKAGQLKLPELEAFFQFLSKKFENFLENVVLKRQLSLIEEETLKLKGFSIDKGILKEKRDIRLKEIENWKEKAISFFKKNEDKSKEKNGFDVYNLENFERFLDEKAEQAGINLEDRRYQGFKQDVFQYFESLERQEKDCKYFFICLNFIQKLINIYLLF